MKIWFRWSVVIVILVSFALLCTRFVSYFILPFAEHSTHLVTIYKVFKFNFFTCSTQNDIFLMLLSFPQQTLFDVPQFLLLLLLRLLLNFIVGVVRTLSIVFAVHIISVSFALDCLTFCVYCSIKHIKMHHAHIKF